MRLRLQNVGRFQDVDLQIPAGCLALVGPNGSGKSTLLNAIELALFADGSRDLAGCLSPWADRLEIELEFEHAGETYRVRRGYKQGSGGRGTATLDLERVELTFNAVDDKLAEWVPLTRETAPATQQAICDLLGLSRDTFNASSFLGQGNSSAFPDASRADRKALLGAILDPRGLWPRLAELARADVKTAETAIAADLLRISEREETVTNLRGLEAHREDLLTVRHEAQRNVDDAEEALQTAQAAVQANAARYERYQAARAAHRTAEMERARAMTELEAAQGFADKLLPARSELAYLDVKAARIPELEAKLEEQRAWLAEQNAMRQRIDDGLANTRQLRAVALRVDAERDAASKKAIALSIEVERLSNAEDGHERCATCEQLLGREARAAALVATSKAFEAAIQEHAEKDALYRVAAGEAQAAQDAFNALPVPEEGGTRDDFDGPLHDARLALAQRGSVAMLIESYEEHRLSIDPLTENLSAAAATLLHKTAELAETAEGMQDAGTLDQAVAAARSTVITRRAALDEAKAAVVRVEEQLARVRQAATELEALRAAINGRQLELDLLKLAERAYGRDGIPALIAENTLGTIEADANMILERMALTDGRVLSVQLQSQRELKNGNVSESLDILVEHQDAPPRELRTLANGRKTFSGGEVFRVSMALRWALAKLLANRRGAESSLLVIDEPDGLDAGGMEALAVIVQEAAQIFDKVIIVSHNPQLSDSFEQSMQISVEDGVSRIAGDRVEVAA